MHAYLSETLCMCVLASSSKCDNAWEGACLLQKINASSSGRFLIRFFYCTNLFGFRLGNENRCSLIIYFFNLLI